MALWISRDDYGRGDEAYEVWVCKPTKTFSIDMALVFNSMSRSPISIDEKCFEGATGIVLNPGELRKVKSIEIVLEPNKRKEPQQ